MIEVMETKGGAYARQRNCQQSRNTSQPDANVQYVQVPTTPSPSANCQFSFQWFFGVFEFRETWKPSLKEDPGGGFR